MGGGGGEQIWQHTHTPKGPPCHLAAGSDAVLTALQYPMTNPHNLRWGGDPDAPCAMKKAPNARTHTRTPMHTHAHTPTPTYYTYTHSLLPKWAFGMSNKIMNEGEQSFWTQAILAGILQKTRRGAGGFGTQNFVSEKGPKLNFLFTIFLFLPL